MARPNTDQSLISAVRQMPAVAKSPIGKTALWAVVAAFVSVVAGGWSFGLHLKALGVVFAAVAGLSLVTLCAIGLIAMVMSVPRVVRRPVPMQDRDTQRHGD
jgi:hypothetical protein